VPAADARPSIDEWPADDTGPAGAGPSVVENCSAVRVIDPWTSRSSVGAAEECLLSSICLKRIAPAITTAGHAGGCCDAQISVGRTQEAPGFTGGFMMWLDAASIRGPFDFQSNALPTELPSRGDQLVELDPGRDVPSRRVTRLCDPDRT
jgi:hypothetical protein